jgi:hypothetical protein
MKLRKWLLPSGLLLLMGIVALGVYLATAEFDTTLEVTVRDAVSKNWVWDATLEIQDRVIHSYYQSDAGPVSYRFTNLEPGETTLEISAPSYVPVRLPIELERGRNILADPVEMSGYEIPGLDHFVIFESLDGNDIVSEIRPVGGDGRAVLNHPCVDLWIGCQVSTQVREGLYVQEPTESGSFRGEALFQGRIDVTFDPLPETTFRYGSRIPGALLGANPAPYLVIDYLIVVPDARKITRAEIEALMASAGGLGDPEALAALLETRRDALSYYFDTSWNVERGAP